MAPPESQANRYELLFSEHRTPAIPQLWPWQKEVLVAYDSTAGDAAIELPTGTGKTLLGLLAGEEFRRRDGGSPVAYLTGNKQLAQQVERQAQDLGLPAVRFQGPKDTWEPRHVRAFNWGRAIGVMNYWNYFNANPGVEPARMLILDDVHLLEGPLREYFTVTIIRRDPLYAEVLKRISARCPYYAMVEDLLHDVDAPRPPEMLVFPDSAELASEVRSLLDAHVLDGHDPRWWPWQQIRGHLDVCCWLVSGRAVTLTPYIPPSQTLQYFSAPAHRLYLSATVGGVDDLQRRLGTPPLAKLTASVLPRQGRRYVAMYGETESLRGGALVDAVRPLLQKSPKGLWLCARREVADEVQDALKQGGLAGGVWRLAGDNAADEPFTAANAGHLVTAGRYDGMDFPDDACRVEIVPEVPVATSELEEFVTAFLRDASFSEHRLAQRVAQALGRCNRSENDRAVYLLTDPEFVARFSQLRAITALPDDVAVDVAAALERADDGLAASLAEAAEFLDGRSFDPVVDLPTKPITGTPETAANEVEAFLALWREDYGRAAMLCHRVAGDLAPTPEYRAFWLAVRALALQLAARYGDADAARGAQQALDAAATAGSASTFFTRLRFAALRLAGRREPAGGPDYDDLFAAWDQLVTRHGTEGPRFDRWAAKLLADLTANQHNLVAQAIARVGSELLGLAAAAPEATEGEPDAHWDLPAPRRILTFEVKLAPETHRITNHDVEQAEGAARAIESQRSRGARGLLVTPYPQAEQAAVDRLERTRLIEQSVFAGEVEGLLATLREYRRGYRDDAKERAQARARAETGLPPLDWLWSALDRSDVRVEHPALGAARSRRPPGAT